MHVQSHTLSANKRTRIHHPGRFFLLIEAGADLEVRFEKDGSPTGEIATDVQAGFKAFPGDWSDPDDGAFDTIVLTSATAQTVVTGISQSAADYARVVSLVQLEQPNVLSSIVDFAVTTTAGQKMPPNTSRKTLTIQHIAGTGVARIGNAAITATRGLRLKPGESVTLTSTSDVYMRTETGTATCSVLEENKS